MPVDRAVDNCQLIDIRGLLLEGSFPDSVGWAVKGGCVEGRRDGVGLIVEGSAPGNGPQLETCARSKVAENRRVGSGSRLRRGSAP